MYVCLDCYNTFEEPKPYVETHGLDSPPYECWQGCPNCGGTYSEAFRCELCGEHITEDYFKDENGNKYCESHFTLINLGDEQII